MSSSWSLRARRLSMADDLRLQRRCQALFDSLHLPTAITVSDLTKTISEKRGCSVQLMALPGLKVTGGACGLAITTDDGVIVAVEHATDPTHQKHISFHELAHLLFGHRHQTVGISDERLDQLAPTVGVERSRWHLVQARGNYDQVEEREAEALGTLLLARSLEPAAAVTVDSPVLRGLSMVLGARR